MKVWSASSAPEEADLSRLAAAAASTYLPSGAGVLDWLEGGPEFEEAEKARMWATEVAAAAGCVAPPSSRAPVSLYDLLDMEADDSVKADIVTPLQGLGRRGHDLEGIRPTVLGERGGKAVRVCLQCYVDKEIDDSSWIQCECGRSRCLACAAHACLCGRWPRGEAPIIADGDVDGRLTFEWSPRMVCGGTDDGWMILDAGQEAVGEPINEGVSSVAGTCARCSRNLGEWGCAWRICRCLRSYCTACTSYACPFCGGTFLETSHSGLGVVPKEGDAT